MPDSGRAAWWQEASSIAARHAPRARGEEPADLAQEAILHLLRRPADNGSTGAWLEVTTRNLATDRWRRSIREGRALRDLAQAPRERETPEEEALRHEQRQAIRSAIRAIPAEQRRLVLMRFYSDLSYAELAERLGIPEVTARTRTHRALSRLREVLGQARLLLLPLGWWKPAAVALVLALGVRFDLPPPELLVAESSSPAAGPSAVRPARYRSIPTASPAAGVVPERSRAQARQPVVMPQSVRGDSIFFAFDEPDVVVSEVQRPLLDGLIWGDPTTSFEPLVEVPPSFVPEIAKSLEEL